MEERVTKVSFNLSEKTLDTLKALAERRGTSMAEIVRQAISIEQLLSDTSEQGGKVLIEDRDKRLKQLVLR